MGPRVPVPLVPPHQDRSLPGPSVTRASGLGDRRGPVPPVAVAVSGRCCVDQAGRRCVGSGVPRGGQRAHAGNGRPRRLGQETALRPAPLSVPRAGRAAGPVWLRLGRFPRCGCRAGYSLLSPPPPPRSSAIQLIARLLSQLCERVWVPETPSREAGPQGRLSPSVPPRMPVAGCPRRTAPLAPGLPRSRRPRPVPGLRAHARLLPGLRRCPSVSPGALRHTESP